MNNLKIKIVIPVYEGLDYLPDLFKTLILALAKFPESEIIVVDDQSTDGSKEWLVTNQPQVKILTSTDKLLFARGANLGLKKALEENADYVFLLNQDTEVEENFLEPLLKMIEADLRIGAIQPRIKLHREKNLINSDGSVIHFLGFGFAYGHKLPASPQVVNGQEVNYCSGAATLFRSSALRKVGLFDENLQMYHEDLDLGWRLSLAGFRNILCLDSIIYHKYEFSRSITKLFFMERNRFWVILKNYQARTIFLILPLLILTELGLVGVALFKGWLRQEFKALAYYGHYKNWQELWRLRKIVQSQRQVSDNLVVRKFAARLEFQEMPSTVVKYLANPVMVIYWGIIKRFI